MPSARRSLVAGELRHLRFTPPPPFPGALGRGVGALVRVLQGRNAPSPFVLTPWGIVWGRGFPWHMIRWLQHSTRIGDDADRTEVSRLEVMLSNGHILKGERTHTSALDFLTDRYGRYAADAHRPFSLDPFQPKTVLGGSEDAFARLLEHVRGWLSSDAGRDLYEVETDDYRQAKRRLSGSVIEVLRRSIVDAPSGNDAGPVAAILAAELDVRELVDELCKMGMSANPIVAVIARGAAVRLGAHRSRAGPLDELEQFVSEPELARIADWAGARDGEAATT